MTEAAAPNQIGFAVEFHTQRRRRLVVLATATLLLRQHCVSLLKQYVCHLNQIFHPRLLQVFLQSLRPKLLQLFPIGLVLLNKGLHLFYHATR